MEDQLLQDIHHQVLVVLDQPNPTPQHQVRGLDRDLDLGQLQGQQGHDIPGRLGHDLLGQLDPLELESCQID